MPWVAEGYGDDGFGPNILHVPKPGADSSVWRSMFMVRPFSSFFANEVV